MYCLIGDCVWSFHCIDIIRKSREIKFSYKSFAVFWAYTVDCHNFTKAIFMILLKCKYQNTVSCWIYAPLIKCIHGWFIVRKTAGTKGVTFTLSLANRIRQNRKNCVASVALCGAAVNMGFLFTRKIVGGASTLPGPLGVASETQWMHTPREKNMPLSFTVVPLYATSTTKN